MSTMNIQQINSCIILERERESILSCIPLQRFLFNVHGFDGAFTNLLTQLEKKRYAWIQKKKNRYTKKFLRTERKKAHQNYLLLRLLFLLLSVLLSSFRSLFIRFSIVSGFFGCFFFVVSLLLFLIHLSVHFWSSSNC